VNSHSACFYVFFCCGNPCWGRSTKCIFIPV